MEKSERKQRQGLENTFNLAIRKNFYSKKLDYKGIPIKSALEVADEALFEAWKRLHMMLDNEPNIVANLSGAGAQLHIIGKKQSTSDLPENRHLKGTLIGGVDFDARTRGTGGLFASCGEENLLQLKSDRYGGRDICVHEFAHTIFSFGLCDTAREAVINQHRWSTHKGLWEGCYAATNYCEFFAELSMWYFGTRGDGGPIEPPPNRGAAWLRRYDMGAFAILDDIYSGRAKSRTPEWKPLAPISVDMENQMFSQSSDVSTQIRIVNESNMLLKAYWLNHQGKRIFYSTIDSGDTFTQITYVTHPWLLTNEHDRGVSIYVAAGIPGIAKIS